jgi:hypothetical protein
MALRMMQNMHQAPLQDVGSMQWLATMTWWNLTFLNFEPRLILVARER